MWLSSIILLNFDKSYIIYILYFNLSLSIYSIFEIGLFTFYNNLYSVLK